VNQPHPRVRRRDLLRLRRLGRELGAERSARAPGSTGAGDLIKASRPAMGSYFEVRIGASVPGAVDLATRALDVIDALEGQLTVYRDDSELSRLNATAHLGPVEVEAGLFGLLEHAVEIGSATAGAYDVTAGALSVAWGFFKGPKRVPEPDVLADARARTGQQHLQLDRESRTVTFDRPGIVLNLGSIGKGYAIDRAIAVIQSHWWPTAALVHGGRSSLYALGSPPGQLAGRWEIAVRNPFRPETPVGAFRLRNRAMGTSGTTFQRFESGGRLYGHILDPRTGEPALGPASVSAIAGTAAEADALSTAFYLIGPESTAAYVAAHPGVGALFIDEGASDASPRIRAFGLADDEFVLAS
jgi:thiamine biosynthesis lipoprotein